MKMHDAGVDWLTMTWEPGHPNYIRALTNVRAEMSIRAVAGDELMPYHWNGYTGEKQGKIAYGERHDGLVVRVSGRDARHIAQMLKERNASGKATRIDFQTTAKTNQANEVYLRRLREKVRHGVSGENGIPARNLASYSHRGRDCGVAVGSRCSGAYIRIYDKSLEQSNRVEKGLIRYEVEYKGKKAREAWKMYQSSAQPYYLACSLTKAECEVIGVEMEWLLAVEQVEFVSSYEGTSVDKKMAWLARFVRPTIHYLLARIPREEILEALGLQV